MNIEFFGKKADELFIRLTLFCRGGEIDFDTAVVHHILDHRPGCIGAGADGECDKTLTLELADKCI